jgi:hypothetical protein
MSDFFDTTQVRDDARHWDAVAERVAANAARQSKGRAFDWLAHSRAGWVAISFLSAAALALIVLPTDNSSVTSRSAEWVQALAPADDVARAIITRDAPPAIGALLLAWRGGV